MTRNEKMELKDTALNATFKIAGTDYDRRRRLTNRDLYGIKRSAQAKSFDPREVADRYGVSVATIKYHTDEAYRTAKNKKRVEYAFNSEYDGNYKADLAEYKRNLIQMGKRLRTSK